MHLEVPEDIAREEAPEIPLVTPHPVDMPGCPSRGAGPSGRPDPRLPRPLVMLGAAASWPRLAEPCSEFVRRVRIPFINTQMGKGALAGGSNLYMGTAALSERDYVPMAVDRADLIIPSATIRSRNRPSSRWVRTGRRCCTWAICLPPWRRCSSRMPKW